MTKMTREESDAQVRSAFKVLNKIFVWVLLPLATIMMLVLFFPLGIVFGILWILNVRKYNKDQKKVSTVA